MASYLWNEFEFAVPLWNRGGVTARNLKGLVTYDRKMKKDAYYWYKANWNSDPMIYIADRRLVKRKNPLTTITVYCNKGIPALTINGKKIAAPEQGYTKVHFLFKNVQLKKGKNIITAKTSDGDKILTDSVEWELSEP